MTWRRQTRTVEQAWDTRKIDEDMLAHQIDSMEFSNGHAETMAADLMKKLTATCDAIMTRRAKAQRKPPVYWWSATLSQL